jgi:hypothetical protein
MQGAAIFSSIRVLRVNFYTPAFVPKVSSPTKRAPRSVSRVGFRYSLPLAARAAEGVGNGVPHQWRLPPGVHRPCPPRVRTPELSATPANVTDPYTTVLQWNASVLQSAPNAAVSGGFRNTNADTEDAGSLPSAQK